MKPSRGNRTVFGWNPLVNIVFAFCALGIGNRLVFPAVEDMPSWAVAGSGLLCGLVGLAMSAITWRIACWASPKEESAATTGQDDTGIQTVGTGIEDDGPDRVSDEQPTDPTATEPDPAPGPGTHPAAATDDAQAPPDAQDPCPVHGSHPHRPIRFGTWVYLINVFCFSLVTSRLFILPLDQPSPWLIYGSGAAAGLAGVLFTWVAEGVARWADRPGRRPAPVDEPDAN